MKGEVSISGEGDYVSDGCWSFCCNNSCNNCFSCAWSLRNLVISLNKGTPI